jgi:hypothetical protein
MNIPELFTGPTVESLDAVLKPALYWAAYLADILNKPEEAIEMVNQATEKHHGIPPLVEIVPPQLNNAVWGFRFGNGEVLFYSANSRKMIVC